MSDITAKYGKDYKVYLYNGGLFNGAKKDKDALSVMEMIEGNEHTEFEVNDNEELLQDIENGVVSGSAISEGIAKGINQAVADNKAEKGEENSDYIEAIDSAEVIEADAFENVETTETTSEEIVNNTENDLNTLAGAKKAFTGIESDRLKPKASMDIIDQFEQLQAYQDVADTISDSMTGATLRVEFAEGEADKYIEIVTIDNSESDSTRIFNITIGDPEGEYTVSAHSTAVAKIIDDEEQVRAKVSLAEEEVSSLDGNNSASITIKREGGKNDLVSVMLRSKSNTAMSGRDFSPVSAEVVFPFGVTERTINIPIDTSHITSESDFSVYIDTPVSCEIGEISETKVILNPSTESDNNLVRTMSIDDSENYGIQVRMNEESYKQNKRVYFPRVYTQNSATRYIEKSGNFKDVAKQKVIMAGI